MQKYLLLVLYTLYPWKMFKRGILSRENIHKDAYYMQLFYKIQTNRSINTAVMEVHAFHSWKAV